MSKWARIVDNLVVETTNIDPKGRFTAELVVQFKECPEEVQPNWQYIDGVFSECIMQYLIRNGIYLYGYYQTGDIVVTERPTPPNSYTFYEWVNETIGWKIDLATSLDALNSSYDTKKKRLHEAHSTILIALALGKITQEQADERTTVVASEYGTMWDDILSKQEVLRNG